MDTVALNKMLAVDTQQMMEAIKSSVELLARTNSLTKAEIHELLDHAYVLGRVSVQQEIHTELMKGKKNGI